MRIPNPFSFLNVKATNMTGITEVITTHDGKEARCKMLQADVKGKMISIIFKDNTYQLLAPITSDSQPIAGVKDRNRLHIPADTTTFGTLNHKSWKKLSQDLPDETIEIQQLATRLIEKEKNFKAVRFVKWSARSITNLTSRVYNHRLAAPTAKWALLAFAACSGLFYLRHASCEYNQPANTTPTLVIDDSWITRATLFVRGLLF